MHYLGEIQDVKKSKHPQWYKVSETENCKSSCKKKYFFTLPSMPVICRNRCRHFQLEKNIISCCMFHAFRWLLIYHITDGTNCHLGGKNGNKIVTSELVEVTRLKNQGLFPLCEWGNSRKCLSLLMDISKNLFKNSNATDLFILLYGEKSTAWSSRSEVLNPQAADW